MALGRVCVKHLSAADLVNYQVVFPPIDEQDQIVRFLDWKTSEMNRVIHAKNQEIKRLKELRVVAINTAVTRGVKGYPLKRVVLHGLMKFRKTGTCFRAKDCFS